MIGAILCCMLTLTFPADGFPVLYEEDAVGRPTDKQTPQPLLLFLIDGFRWDYLDRYERGELPGFQRLVEGGTRAEYLVPDYLSDSYPNYYSLMTGLHTENHGMVHNFMWDPLYPDQEFLIGGNEDQYNPHWWNDAEPFWVTAEKQNQSVYMWYWPGCEVEILGRRPSFCAPYQNHSNPSPELLRQAIESALEVIANQTALIAGIYYERVDYVGHAAGPYSLDETIRNLDKELSHMFTLLDNLGLEDEINIVLFSDHGMSNFSRGNLIYMPDLVNETDYERMILGSTSTQIWPHEGELDTLYDKLKNAHPHLTVYKREDIPSEWHNSDHRRIPPLFLTADIDWIMTDYQRALNPGRHGYNISFEDMWGVFVARGPSFKGNYTARGFSNVNVYQVLCHVTSVECLAHNGSWSEVCDIFKEDSCRNDTEEAIARIEGGIEIERKSSLGEANETAGVKEDCELKVGEAISDIGGVVEKSSPDINNTEEAKKVGVQGDPCSKQTGESIADIRGVTETNSEVNTPEQNDSESEEVSVETKALKDTPNERIVDKFIIGGRNMGESIADGETGSNPAASGIGETGKVEERETADLSVENMEGAITTNKGVTGSADNGDGVENEETIETFVAWW